MWQHQVVLRSAIEGNTKFSPWSDYVELGTNVKPQQLDLRFDSLSPSVVYHANEFHSIMLLASNFLKSNLQIFQAFLFLLSW